MNEDKKKDFQKNVEEYKELLDETTRLAYIGKHFLNFITVCRMKKIDPLYVIEITLKKKGIDSSKLPMVAFITWLVEPTEENFKNLASALNVDFDAIIESMKKEKKDV